MTARSIETVAWFGLYVVFALFALTYVGAPPLYRAIYVDHTATDWVQTLRRDYLPGTRIEGNELSPYFGGMWWHVEADGRWGRGSRNSIEVVPTRTIEAGTRVTGRYRSLVGGTQPTRVVRIEVNGVEVYRRLHRSSEQVAFDVPVPHRVEAGETLEVTFVTPEARSPLSMHLGDDFRELGVFLYELTVDPDATTGNASHSR